MLARVLKGRSPNEIALADGRMVASAVKVNVSEGDDCIARKQGVSDMLPLLYCVVTLNEFFQIPLSAMFSGAHYCGIDYVYEVTTCAVGETRTPTGFPPSPPQSDVSTIPPLPHISLK